MNARQMAASVGAGGVYVVPPGQSLTSWVVSPPMESYFPGEAAPAEDRVGYRFTNGFVDVGDLPCRKAFRATMPGRSIEPETDWPVDHLNLPGSNRRVEFTGFWHVPTHVRRWLRSTWRAEADGTVELLLRTCGGIRVWVNGIERVRFEPFLRNVESETRVRLPLLAGDNEILVHSEDLAERDTVWFVEMELGGDMPLTVLLPVAVDRDALARLEALARQVRPARDVFAGAPLELLFDTPAGVDLPVEVRIVSHGHDRSCLAASETTLGARETRLVVAGSERVGSGYHGVRLSLGTGAGKVTRALDAAFIDDLAPAPLGATLADRKRRALDFAARHGAPRIGRVLAMLASGNVEPEAMAAIVDATLATIDRAEDCSDFVMVPLLWLVGAHGDRLPAAMADRIRASVLAYRYWVDEPGNDAMWFWSENHVLCFHTSQLIAGRLYPDDQFLRSGRSGREQAALAEERLGRWFDSVEAHGLAEWNSAAYYPIDFIGLLALHRWADAPVAARARGLLDRIFTMIALHTLAGVPAGSQGRAYDKELRAGPLTELAPFATVAFGRGWLNGGVAALPMFCAGPYEPPAGLADLADLAAGRSIEARYAQGLEPGKLVLFKTEAAQLSTVVDHKTGKPGHQQHVLDIRLAGHPMARLWVNHPGEDDPWGTQRPSYWAGSGILPRVAQHRDVALLVADPRAARIRWTHAYVGRDGMDEILIEDGWLIVRSGRGFAALHASNGLTPVESGATAGHEVRTGEGPVGWVAVIGSGDAHAFDTFRARLRASPVAFDRDALRLDFSPDGREALSLASDGTFSVGGQRIGFDHTGPIPVLTYDSADPRLDAFSPFFA